MAEYADAVICVWDGKSKGTWSMIKYASDKAMPLYIHLDNSLAEMGWRALLTGLPPQWWRSSGLEALSIACWLNGCASMTAGEITAEDVFESICEEGSRIREVL